MPRCPMIHYTLPHSSALYGVLGRLNTCTALRLCAVAQNDGDELLRRLILAVLAKAERPMDAEEIAERISRMLGVPPLVPERGH